jgi:hypothetical protein
MKYLAQIELQKRLAPLPESISLSSEHELVSGLMGAKNCDLSSLRRGPFHQNFANWRSATDGIVEFTRQYGPLDWRGEFAGVHQTAGLKFYFLAALWRERQAEFRKLWETALTEGPDRMTWLTLPVAGDFPVATETDGYAKPANYGREGDDGRLIWQTPETLWEPSRNGPTALVVAQTTWQYLCLLLTFEKVEQLRKCENPDCAAPYFIARRKDRVFCSEDCAHLIAARRWWTKHGNEWRQRRRKRRTT